MAIVKMRKLHLAAMSYDRDVVLNALQKTGAVEITLHEETERTRTLKADAEGLKTELSSFEAALSVLCAEVENYEREKGKKSTLLKDGFDVPYSEFMSMKGERARADEITKKINALTDEKNALQSELAQARKEKSQREIYACLQMSFHAFCDTAHTRTRLGVLPTIACESLKEDLKSVALCAYEIVNTESENTLVFVTAHKAAIGEVDGILSARGFSACPYQGAVTGAQLYAEAEHKIQELMDKLEQNKATMYALKDEIRFLKTYCDYLLFELEKEETSEKLRGTEKTFLLQAYLPEFAETEVAETLRSLSGASYFEFSDPTEEENPPTLLSNNAVVSNFEGITNTYSAPNYREFDPNAVMAFFYSLFMGFIIGDMGYGILMSLIGGYIWLKNKARPSGLSRLAGAFAVGGVFAVFWGALFNSLFGFAIFGAGNAIMPDPQKDMWSLAGIAVPSVLVISMELGVFQICVGYLCKAWQSWRKKQILDGICDGVFWALFSVGIGVAIVGFVEEAKVPFLGAVGGILAGVSLLLAMLTAGRKEKFFGKFTKGFGAAYGVINYASDILSYARLYGLMLSGAVIAQIIATYSGQFIVSGNILLVLLGVLLLLVGHGFNLVMNLLGAYIHDARLQYVEFYGRFFEGEGELFTPLGSKRKYVELLPAQKEQKA